MDLILHHYPTSPWAEVVRLSLGLKDADWGSVIIPVTAPKPDLVPLTGGYIRTPVLQMGADIICDTLAILDRLEPLPGPSLYPVPLGRAHRSLAQEAGGPLFFSAVGEALGAIPPETPGMDAFWADRETRFGLDRAGFAAMLPRLHLIFEAHVERLETMLADGRPTLGGGVQPGHGDLAHYMLLWFAAGGAAGVPRRFPRLGVWAERVAALGHGRRTDLTAADAHAVARRSVPRPITPAVDEPGSRLQVGQRVAVAQEGCRDAPVIGDLLRFGPEGITLRRDDPDLGLLHIHYPREGQIVTAA